jgi:hypothetical protein
MLADHRLGQQLFGLLKSRNGFYAFEQALHVFPVSCSGLPVDYDLETWNSPGLWRGEYADLAEGLLFFAEDIFQDQFCLSAAGVLRFKAETGRAEVMGDSVEHWARRVLSRHREETGWPFAREWQARNGPLPRGKRLMPITPFFLGGAFEIGNLWAGDALQGMRAKGDLAVQTKSLPEGTVVKLRVGTKPPG